MSNDTALQTSLQDAQRQVDGQAPDFTSVFAAAESQVRTRSRVRFSGLAAAVAAIAIVAATLSLLPEEQDEFIYVDIEELTATTSWSAPSDSLLPEHSIDLYHELPKLFESTNMSTNTDEGTLL